MASALRRTFTRAKSPQPPKAFASSSIINTPTSPPSTISETPVSNSNSPSPAPNQSSTRQNVRVVVRVRPPNAVEMNRGDTEVWEAESDKCRVSLQADYCERYKKQMAEYYYGKLTICNFLVLDSNTSTNSFSYTYTYI